MVIRLELDYAEIAVLTSLAEEMGRAPATVATEAVRARLARRVELRDHVDRVVREDAELLGRLADS